MIKENLIAERIAVEFYSEIIRWLGDRDLTTRKVMQEILAVEAQHAEDMQHLLGRMTRNRADRQVVRAISRGIRTLIVSRNDSLTPNQQIHGNASPPQRVLAKTPWAQIATHLLAVTIGFFLSLMAPGHKDRQPIFWRQGIHIRPCPWRRRG